MRRNSILYVASSVFMASLALPAAATVFDFDDGTSQGWTVELLNPGGGPFGAGWSDINNYPSAPRTDPADGSNGSAFTAGGAWDGTDGFRIVQFISPDLTGDTMWQNLESFSGQLLPSFQSITPGAYFANALLVIDDTTGGGSVERTFANGTADGIGTDMWNLESFTGIDTLLAGTGVSSYTTNQVVFQIFSNSELDSETFYALDDVTPTAASTGPGGSDTVPVPEPGSIALISLGLAGLLCARRRREPGA